MVVGPISALESFGTNMHHITCGVVNNTQPVVDRFIITDFTLDVTLAVWSGRVVVITAASGGAGGALLSIVHLDTHVLCARSDIHRRSDGRSQTSRAGVDELPSHTIVLRAGFEANLVAVAAIGKFTAHANSLALRSD